MSSHLSTDSQYREKPDPALVAGFLSPGGLFFVYNSRGRGARARRLPKSPDRRNGTSETGPRAGSSYPPTHCRPPGKTRTRQRLRLWRPATRGSIRLKMLCLWPSEWPQERRSDLTYTLAWPRLMAGFVSPGLACPQGCGEFRDEFSHRVLCSVPFV